jgi:mono/diheme cytochrome c family protein
MATNQRSVNTIAHLDQSLPADEQTSPPLLLSQTGALTDLKTLQPAPGLIPYDINVPFWSDGAQKKRWIALPGRTESDRINFHPAGEWQFPRGTVFVKQFEIGGTAATPPVRLETRFIVVTGPSQVYGASYRWRADNSDADLVVQPHRENVSYTNAEGVQSQSWYFPGLRDCKICHTAQAGGVLGVNTRQMNRAFAGDESTSNQLLLWAHNGMFDQSITIGEVASFSKLLPPNDEKQPLVDRARSYLDANCAQCHRPGGAPGYFDARFETPLALQNLINGPVLINMALDRARTIAPHDPWRSIILNRVTAHNDLRMPPLAHERVDPAGEKLLRKWIASIPGQPVLSPPTLLPDGGDFNSTVTITLHHTDAAVTLRYTLDGSSPTEESTAYRKPILIADPTTVRVKAYKPGYARSITVQQTYVVHR